MKKSFLSLIFLFALIFLFVPFPYFTVYGDDNGEDVNKFINSFSIFKNTRFNRVDGLFVGFELEAIPVAYPDFTFLTRFGYSFILQKPGFLVDVERKFGEEKKLAVGVFYREETVSNEDHIVNTIKNSVSAFLIKKDYKDYYYIKSGGLKLSYIINENMISIKRPGTGLKPYNLDKIIGKKTKRNISQDEIIQLDMIE